MVAVCLQAHEHAQRAPGHHISGDKLAQFRLLLFEIDGRRGQAFMAEPLLDLGREAQGKNLGARWG